MSSVRPLAQVKDFAAGKNFYSLKFDPSHAPAAKPSAANPSAFRRFIAYGVQDQVEFARFAASGLHVIAKGAMRALAKTTGARLSKYETALDSGFNYANWLAEKHWSALSGGLSYNEYINPQGYNRTLSYYAFAAPFMLGLAGAAYGTKALRATKGLKGRLQRHLRLNEIAEALERGPGPAPAARWQAALLDAGHEMAEGLREFNNLPKLRKLDVSAARKHAQARKDINLALNLAGWAADNPGRINARTIRILATAFKQADNSFNLVFPPVRANKAAAARGAAITLAPPMPNPADLAHEIIGSMATRGYGIVPRAKIEKIAQRIRRSNNAELLENIKRDLKGLNAILKSKNELNPEGVACFGRAQAGFRTALHAARERNANVVNEFYIANCLRRAHTDLDRGLEAISQTPTTSAAEVLNFAEIRHAPGTAQVRRRSIITPQVLDEDKKMKTQSLAGAFSFSLKSRESVIFVPSPDGYRLLYRDTPNHNPIEMNEMRAKIFLGEANYNFFLERGMKFDADGHTVLSKENFKNYFSLRPLTGSTEGLAELEGKTFAELRVPRDISEKRIRFKQTTESIKHNLSEAVEAIKSNKPGIAKAWLKRSEQLTESSNLSPEAKARFSQYIAQCREFLDKTGIFSSEEIGQAFAWARNLKRKTVNAKTEATVPAKRKVETSAKKKRHAPTKVRQRDQAEIEPRGILRLESEAAGGGKRKFPKEPAE